MSVRVDVKSLVASKTFWTNVAGLVALVAPVVYPPAGVLGEPEVQAQLVGAILVVANIVLRVVSSGPIGSVLPK